MNRRQVTIGAACGVVLLVTVVVVLSVTLTSGDKLLPHRLDPQRCPKDYGHRPVLLVSLDGFRPDYLKRGLTPTIQKLAEKGVSSPYMKASYPTVTFPNHYTIVTGLYPESHGIIGNFFFDPVFQDIFSLSSATKVNGSWWDGEPIWNTLAFQGKKSASYFWPGSDSDIQGRHPTHYFPYDGKVPYEQRVQEVLEWLSLPAEVRPHWVSLYFDEPDHQGHQTGPDSPEVDEQLLRVDAVVTSLVEGLAQRNLLHCVNMIIVADHGMADAGPHKVIELDKIYPEIREDADVIFGSASRIKVKNQNQEAILDLQRRLTCQRKELRVFRREDLPKRLHYSTHRRIEPLVVDLDPGFTIQDLRPNRSKRTPLEGRHGYDYYFPEMNALFLGYGPDLQQGVVVEPFQNVELYNLMCALTSVQPAPNNGTWGALHHLLANPPPASPPPAPQQVRPPTLSYSKDATKPQEVTGDCGGDLATSKAWYSALALTASQQQEAEKRHLPWGVPYSDALSPRLVLLQHHTHVTGYSQALKVPLWTSFTVTDAPSHTPVEPWSSDPRLRPDDVPSCTFYNALTNLTMTPLFPPMFAGGRSTSPHSRATINSWPQVPFMVTNAVAMSSQLVKRWNHLLGKLVPSWFNKFGPINVVLGPVFDADHNSRRDQLTSLRVPAVPTDVFAVVTRCRDPVTSLDQCDPQSVDALAFIFPQLLPVTNCLADSRYAHMYSAKVRDVELNTGLTFYPHLTHQGRLRVTLRIHSDLWA